MVCVLVCAIYLCWGFISYHPCAAYTYAIFFVILIPFCYASSDEKLKWLSWPEYLEVVRALQADLVDCVETYLTAAAAAAASNKGNRESNEKALINNLGVFEKEVERDVGMGMRMGREDRRSLNGKMKKDRLAALVSSQAEIDVSSVSSTSASASYALVTGTAFASVSTSASASGLASKKKTVAKLYQRYLLLAFFSCVPDRQRTFRELELGRTLVKIKEGRDSDGEEYGVGNIDGDLNSYNIRRVLSIGMDIESSNSNTGTGSYNDGGDNNGAGYWAIQHGPEDYKTGKSYGNRPPLVISPGLTTGSELEPYSYS